MNYFTHTGFLATGIPDNWGANTLLYVMEHDHITLAYNYSYSGSGNYDGWGWYSRCTHEYTTKRTSPFLREIFFRHFWENIFRCQQHVSAHAKKAPQYVQHTIFQL